MVGPAGTARGVSEGCQSVRLRSPYSFGHSTIWVQRNRAIVLSVSRCLTVASQSWVMRPRCAASARHSMTPSCAVPKKFDFSSIVVKPVDPSGNARTQPYPLAVSARVTTLPAWRKPFGAIRCFFYGQFCDCESVADFQEVNAQMSG